MKEKSTVKISDFNYRENIFHDGEKKYRVTDILKIAENIESFDLPLSGINIGCDVWNMNSIKSFVYHVKRLKEADLNIPIILDSDGFICDGWHRVAKAILEGKETIKAKRLNVMPEPLKGEN